MADLKAIRDALKTRIETVSGLKGYDTYTPQVLVPCAIVMPAPGEFLAEVTMDAVEDLDLVVLVLLQKILEDVAQDNADTYLSEGSSNIANAIDSGSTSDWDFAVSGAARGYGTYVFGDGEQALTYLGYEIPVRVGVS